MRRLLTTLIALALGAATSHAGTSAPGVSLNWDRCFGDGSVQYKDFACDVNTGSDRMVGTFELSSDNPGVTGLEIVLDFKSATGVPTWWTTNAPGGTSGCRGLALTAQLVPPAGAVACSDWAGGQGAGGIAAFRVDNSYSPVHGRLILGSAVPSPVDLVAHQEYFAFTVVVSHAKTVGTGSCAGCLEPMVFFLSSVNVVNGNTGSTLLNRGANYLGSQWISWQRGYASNIGFFCSHNPFGECLGPYVEWTTVPYSVTPTRNSTWGQVKSLYR